MPVTISGVTSDRYSDPARGREVRFQSPYAQSVPTTVEISVATTAMIRLFNADSVNCVSCNAAAYQRSEKPSQTVKREELKLKTERISSGRCRNRNAPTA